jgi:hypothetical protein
MRREDLDILGRPYAQPASEPGKVFRSALGLPLPESTQLREMVLQDLDPDKFGIGWWQSDAGTKRRILISDHLVQCLITLETNLVEARLHLLEVLGCMEDEARFLADAVVLDPMGRPTIRLPAPRNAVDELPRVMLDLHVGGFFRALGSALDCLGAVAIGILALPLPILLADLGKVRKFLATPRKDDDGHHLWKSFGEDLHGLIDSAGPSGWLDWALGFRNMLVHRGRRLHFVLLEQRPSILGADGAPIVRARPIHLLAQDPGRSDIEVLVDGLPPALTESADVTLQELLRSTVALVEGSATFLAQIWTARRQAPGDLPQPMAQWPRVPSGPPPSFLGYEPGRVPTKPNLAAMAPDWLLRLRAASLDGSARRNWETFD